MRLGSAWLAAGPLAFALIAAPVAAEPIGPAYEIVRSGALARIAFHYDPVSHACRSLGPVTINLVAPPQHGALSTARGSARPQFGPSSAYAACDRLRVPGLQIYYRSEPGYTGPDSWVVERVTPTGEARQFRIHVSVR